MSIETAHKKHSGTYGLVLENEYGAQTAAFKVVLDLDKQAYLTSQAQRQHQEYKEIQVLKKPPPKVEAAFGDQLTLETELSGEMMTVDWELEGSAEYFEGETIYKNGTTFATLTIDEVTEDTCGTYVCTAMSSQEMVLIILPHLVWVMK